MLRECLNWRSPSSSSCTSGNLRKPHGRGEARIVEVLWDEIHQDHAATESAKQGSYGLSNTEAATMVPAWVYTRPSASVPWLSVDAFVGLLTVGAGISLVLSHALGILSLLGCLVQSQYAQYESFAL